MNRWAANNPELYEQMVSEGSTDPQGDLMREKADYLRDEAKYEQVSNAPCRVCGEVTTKGGRTCKRCSDSLEDERSQHRPGRD